MVHGRPIGRRYHTSNTNVAQLRSQLSWEIVCNFLSTSILCRSRAKIHNLYFLWTFQYEWELPLKVTSSNIASCSTSSSYLLQLQQTNLTSFPQTPVRACCNRSHLNSMTRITLQHWVFHDFRLCVFLSGMEKVS